MINSRLFATSSCVAIALLNAGCLVDTVRDFVVDQVETREADEGDVAFASVPTDAEAGLLDAGSEDIVNQADAAIGSSSGFDPYDQSAPPTEVSRPQAPREPQRATPQRYELDPSNTGSSPAPTGTTDQPYADRPGTPTGGPTQPVIRLRTAVALPQSLPTGTAMGFSLDYVFSLNAPNADSRYVWVIEPPKGEANQSDVKLSDEGSLSRFVTQWGAKTGTYTTYVDEITSAGKRQTVSNRLKLRYSYP